MTSENMLSRDSLRRIVLSLIMAEQDHRYRNGQIGSDQLISGQIRDQSDGDIEKIEINEERLGFDSLALLELILSVNRFFQLHTSGVEDYLLVHREIGAWIDLIDKHRQIVRADLSFGFATSGSLGKPKVILHRAEHLWSEMRSQIAGPFRDLPTDGRILSLVPCHHIYGFLFGCILPDLQQKVVIDLHRLAPGAAFRIARRGDLIVGTPLNWEHLVAVSRRFEEGVRGVTSAGRSTPETWSILDDAGLAQLTEIFGSTETGGLGSRTGPAQDFILLPHLSRQGQAIRRDGDETDLPLQDTLEWQNMNAFRVAGRIDRSVKVAGVNVSPVQVAESIMGLPSVSKAVARMGAQRLKLFVVPSDRNADTTTLAREIRAHLRATAPAAALPESISFGAQLPMNAMGKAQDWADPAPDLQSADQDTIKVSGLPTN